MFTLSSLNKIIINKRGNHSQLVKLFFSVLSQHRELIASLLSGVIILTTWLIRDYVSSPAWMTLNCFAFAIGGYAKAKEGIEDTIKDKTLNVELLMILAAIGSAIIGYWTEGAILIFIFSLSGALETYTMQKSERDLSALIQLQPDKALRVSSGAEELVSIDQLIINDLIIVKPGDRVAADGVIVKGKSVLDESALTGEAIPIVKSISDEVYTGTINHNGSLTIKVTKKLEDSMVQKIMTLVKAAQKAKSPGQLFIERFENIYVKSVLILVLIMMVLPHYLFGWSWIDTIYRAMILLVVASPCALVASITPAMLSAISNGARKGILFKSGVHLENLEHINAVAFDKTGTLTQGRPIVTDCFIQEGKDKTSILNYASAIEKVSSHPLAEAIVAYADQHQCNQTFIIDEMTEEMGKGVSAVINGERWSIGSEKMVNQEQGWYQEHVTRLMKQAKTVVYLICEDEVVAVLGLKDQIRVEAVRAIQAFKEMGIYTVMLTGDNEHTAQSIAEEVGVDHFIASCLPEDKVTALNQLKASDQTIMMIGDGINDAPALACADIGVAMGAGTDVALETADIVLMKNNLEKLTTAYHLSCKMNRITKQNIYFSIAVISLLILTNFLQVINLPLGVIGHEGSTILVILNGLRLLK
nr:heavy metal translocating P-type ATPase [Amphibacillus sediminis]